MYYSNSNIDKILNELYFKFKKNGFFVDLGASVGVKDSNTYFFEKEMGWQGLCIEGCDIQFPYLLDNRKCHCVNEVVDIKRREVNFLCNGWTGGVIDETFRNKKSVEENKHKIKVASAKSLIQIFSEANVPREIDYLSCDIEGKENEVLMNFDFNKYQIKIITAETISKDLIEKLERINYKYLNKIGRDYLFVLN
jgi:hypothetical protein